MSMRSSGRLGIAMRRPRNAFTERMPDSGRARINCDSSTHDSPITRVFAPFERAHIAGMLPPWRNDCASV
ncbi:hypothetical protein AAB986_05055 [Burkholderia contaminans]|uniref:hypothetical protein n=1 Tax=Burkholderia contaminans TaxID=488447 RepID=UPI0031136F9D